MQLGHLYLAFGNEYDKAAAYSVYGLNKHSRLPVQVLTNLDATTRHKMWSKCKNVQFTFIKSNTHNREIKTKMHQFSIFDYTLYTDCDTIIHSDKFMQVFDVLKGCDVAFPVYEYEESQSRLKTEVYRQAIRDFNLGGALSVYQGGICVFKKNEAANRLFTLWNQYWNVRKFRDMPPLVAAIHNVKDCSVGMISHDYGFPDSEIIQHFYGHRPPPTKDLPQFTKIAADEKQMKWIPKAAWR